MNATQAKEIALSRVFEAEVKSAIKAGGHCGRHPHIVLPSPMSCCPLCEAEIDAAIMPTIFSDLR